MGIGGSKKLMELVDAETTSETITSPSEIVYLPEDLVVIILCKLPVKSLVRLKLVCKAWELVITSTDFINKHLHRKNPQHGGYSLYPMEYRSHEDNIFPVDIIFIVGSCNGIICLGTSCPEKRLLLFNPSTREFSFVPPGLSSWGIYGFCYLPTTQEYKIISFCQRPDDTKIVDITIMTLGKTASLRETKHVDMRGSFYEPRQVTCGTTMVWLGRDDMIAHKEIVIFYDVVEESFSKMVPPPSTYSSHMEYRRCLGVLKDSVIMSVSSTGQARFFDIWTLVDDVSEDRSWIKTRKVELERRLTVNLIDVCWDRWILCGNAAVGDNGYKSSDLFYYDFETEQVEDYKVTDPPILEFVNYVESLVSTHSLVSCIDTNF